MLVVRSSLHWIRRSRPENGATHPQIIICDVQAMGPRLAVVHERAILAPATSRALPTGVTPAEAKRFAPPSGRRNSKVFLHFDALQAATSLFCFVGTGVVDQDPPHYVSRHPDKVLAAVPVGILSC